MTIKKANKHNFRWKAVFNEVFDNPEIANVLSRELKPKTGALKSLRTPLTKVRDQINNVIGYATDAANYAKLLLSNDAFRYTLETALGIISTQPEIAPLIEASYQTADAFIKNIPDPVFENIQTGIKALQFGDKVLGKDDNPPKEVEHPNNTFEELEKLDKGFKLSEKDVRARSDKAQPLFTPDHPTFTDAKKITASHGRPTKPKKGVFDPVNVASNQDVLAPGDPPPPPPGKNSATAVEKIPDDEPTLGDVLESALTGHTNNTIHTGELKGAQSRPQNPSPPKSPKPNSSRPQPPEDPDDEDESDYSEDDSGDEALGETPDVSDVENDEQDDNRNETSEEPPRRDATSRLKFREEPIQLTKKSWLRPSFGNPDMEDLEKGRNHQEEKLAENYFEMFDSFQHDQKFNPDNPLHQNLKKQITLKFSEPLDMTPMIGKSRYKPAYIDPLSVKPVKHYNYLSHGKPGRYVSRHDHELNKYSSPNPNHEKSYVNTHFDGIGMKAGLYIPYEAPFVRGYDRDRSLRIW